MEALETTFCLFFIPKTYFYMHHTLYLQHTKMFNLEDIANEHNEKHNLKWSYILHYPYRMLITGTSGSGKTNALLNLIK